MMKLKNHEEFDFETGETTYYSIILNSETGEEEFTKHSLPAKRKQKPFKIPSCNYTNANSANLENIKPGNSSTIRATAVLFLLPTTVLFYPILALIVVAIEVTLHMWAHRKNKTLKDGFYYQSPLHIICKEFCAACREENSKRKITKIQERRMDKIRKYGLEYVRRIVT